MTAVTVVGRGAIGGAVAEALARGTVPGCTLVDVLDSRSDSRQRLAAVSASDVVVEATSVESAPAVIDLSVRHGCDVIVCSCGALADPAWRGHPTGGGRIVLPAGAIGGFDVLAAVVRADAEEVRVQHVTTKQAAAVGADPAATAPAEVFRGSAREAAQRFPRTSNSSVALALATVGLDRVEVVVVADPHARSTRHTVRCASPLGTYEFTFCNALDAASEGRTSLITAWSVLEALAGLHRGAGPGVVVLAEGGAA